ncbi:sulfatase family protein [Sedimentisphaera salicampi]|uniref:sulfatase family protein n=1 Tax=Sedimentisphaera salicampi TaxID=1941349 RepID=UPI000B9BF822|nr:sulfatase [Sedimentisphaera salicampi]OXU13943.1 Arylsulfatase [Sedimentisphaera salicampi]
MNRRLFLKSTGSLALSLAAVNPVSSFADNHSKQKPNVLWITIEDTSLFFGCYGDEVAKTPNVDKLAEEGTLFTNAFANSPVCSPARTALITGMHVGQLGGGNHRSAAAIPDSVKGFPTYLRKNGYYCTNNKKKDYNFKDAWHWAKRTWDETSGQATWRNRKPGQPFFHVQNFLDSHQSRVSVNSYERFKKNIQSQLSPEEITKPEEVKVPPFYHDTPEVRKAYARMYDCITLVDRQIGELLDKLKEDGLYEETIIFFFADHGEGMPRFKTNPLGLGLRVPLVVRVPKKYRDLVKLKPGTKTDKLISFVDLGPTVLNITGSKIGDNMSGAPVLGPGKIDKEFIFGSTNIVGTAEQHSRTVSDGRYTYVRNYMPHLGYAQPQRYCDGAEIMHLLRDYYKAGELEEAAEAYMSPGRPAEALYDYKFDPWNVHNLAEKTGYESILEKMRSINQNKILEIRDLHFLHPWEIETRGGKFTPFEFKDYSRVYPLEKIMSVAELVGKGRKVLSKQIKALEDEEPAVRYWGLIGLESQNWKKDDIFQHIEPLLEDSAPYIRYEAAKLTLKKKDSKKAKDILISGLKEEHCILVLSAMRNIRLLDRETVKELLPEVRKLKKRISELKGQRLSGTVGSVIASTEAFAAGKYPPPVDSF